MATYIWAPGDGALMAWWASDADAEIATFDQLVIDNGWSKATGLATQDATHRWDPATKTVKDYSPPAPPAPTTRFIPAAQFILLFTPLELEAARASADPVVQQMVLASTVATEVDMLSNQTSGALGYLQSVNLLTADRVAAILAGG